jgi:hypothetical protein
MRVVHHVSHHEEMRMTRLTVTLDEAAAQELSGLRVSEAREVIQRAMQVLPLDESTCYVRLSRSLEELGDGPASSSAVIRQAVDLFFHLLREARSSVALQAGYETLARDRERQELVEVMSEHAPGRWDSEE